jgi:signal transduction histidine kinase
MTGLYFIKSIVRPVREVSGVARKMAMGDFKSRLEVEKKDDEIGELCDAINYMASELGQAENVKNSFISSVSHELRTPLTAIRGWGETAKMSLGFDDELVSKGIDVILSEADRLSGLVEDLLDFSRMQSGRLSLNVEAFDLRRAVRESYEMYVELAKKQDVELLYIPHTEAIVCKGDYNRIKQVFINVIDNALKYNKPGGQILIKSTMEEGCVQIIISDTGVGIAAADLARVKEKFYKANKTVRGSGIGLAVADEIMKQHNGFLLVDSTEGMGTTVTVVLPIYEEEIDNQGDLDEL